MAKKAPSFLISFRFLLALIAFFAYAIQYTQKINQSVAIVCMVNNTALESLKNNLHKHHDHDHDHHNHDHHDHHSHNKSLVTDKCGGLEQNSTAVKLDGQFIWPKDVQGIVMSSYFFGYLITEIPGGYLSLKFGAKLVLGFSILIGSVFTIMLPFLARFHYIAISIGRFIVGAAHGCIWPAFAGFWSSWAPAGERSRLIGTANAGSQIGNVIALPLGGFLCMYGFDGGWPSIFYIFGGVGIIWFVVWMIIATNLPDQNRFIGESEREYVLEETKETRSSHEESETGAPWGKIMSSKVCWAIFLGHSCSNWGTYLFLTSLPSYMKEVLKFDIKSNGALSAVPYLVFWLFIIVSGVIGDKLVMDFKISKTIVRKIFNSLGFFVPMLAVIGLTFVTCEIKYVGVVLLTIGLAFTGCAYGAGFLVNFNDIAGPYSGIVFGISNTFATLPGIIAPYLVSIITKNQKQEEWRIVFLITAVVYLLGALVLLVFTKGSLEPWAIKSKSLGKFKEESIPLKLEEKA